MSQPLDYADPSLQPPSRMLAFFAHGTLAYPLICLGALYSQWLLSWWVLGHPPRPSLDDPVTIPGASWVHPITALFLIGYLPAAFATVSVNAVYLARCTSMRAYPIQGMLFLVLWVGAFVFLQVDPGNVLYWWLD